MKPIVLMPGAGEAIQLGSVVTTVFKAEAGNTDGAVSITENFLAAGFAGPKLHFHRATFDIFYVIEGTMRFRIGEQLVEAPAGSFVLVPPGFPHSFSNPGPRPARMLNIQTPAGLEQYLKEVAAETKEGVPTGKQMAEIASKYDFVSAE